MKKLSVKDGDGFWVDIQIQGPEGPSGPPGPSGQPKYRGSGPPGTIIGSTAGDVYWDYTNGLYYELS